MKRIFPIAAFILVILVNFLANYIPIGGQTTGALSDSYDSLFTPAGFTFSIWGIIYLFLAGYCVFQILPINRSNTLFDKINSLFILNCVANSAWIFAWHYEFLGLSLFMMSIILTTLIMIYRVIRKENLLNPWHKFLIRTPFSLYIGWITVATIANISILQSAQGLNDWLIVEQDWTVIKLGLAGAVGAAMILQQKDIIFGMVGAWASYGIYTKQLGHNDFISGSAVTVMILLLVVVVIQLIASKSAKNAFKAI